VIGSPSTRQNSTPLYSANADRSGGIPVVGFNPTTGIKIRLSANAKLSVKSFGLGCAFRSQRLGHSPAGGDSVPGRRSLLLL
jgi:hypothetical protein